jgi:hemoglobin
VSGYAGDAMDMKPRRAFGDGDASLEAMGGEDGVSRLVDMFFDNMEQLPEARTIHEMHPDTALTREKLKVFLVGWLGGPKRYAERWGRIRIPKAHKHLPIDEAERDQWLLCMDKAVDAMPVSDDFRSYFKEQIRVPAGRVMEASQRRRASE